MGSDDACVILADIGISIAVGLGEESARWHLAMSQRPTTIEAAIATPMSIPNSFLFNDLAMISAPGTPVGIIRR